MSRPTRPRPNPPFSALEANTPLKRCGTRRHSRPVTWPVPPSRAGLPGEKEGLSEVRKHPLSLSVILLVGRDGFLSARTALRSRSPAVSQFYLAGFDPKSLNPSVRDPAPLDFCCATHPFPFRAMYIMSPSNRAR